MANETLLKQPVRLTAVMAGFIPAIHVLLKHRRKTWMPGVQTSEATPVFERKCLGMTQL
jgi:hypothetical protein